MLPDYRDIRSRIKEEPIWYDDNGVPRYDKFSPDLVSSIYAQEALLVKIKCQDCHSVFFVGVCYSDMEKIFNRHAASYEEHIKDYLNAKDKNKRYFPFHYGDPPAHGCVGDTMNCEDIQIIEFWKKEKFVWKRKPEYEIKAEEE